MKTLKGKALFMGMMAGMAKKGGPMGAGEAMMKPENMGPMMQMMGGFTVLRLTKLMSAANIEFTKEELLDLNEKLNKIKKKD